MTDKGALQKSLLWLAIAGTGVVGGLLLGQLAIGGLGSDEGGMASYAELTGNPNALAVESQAVEPCYDCADGSGYGTAMQSRFAREGRMADEFRELGAVEIDYASEPTDDYRYGGRFDDADVAPPIVMQSPVAVLPAVPQAGPSEASLPLPTKAPPPATEPEPAEIAPPQ
jgi:hypothetical protein